MSLELLPLVAGGFSRLRRDTGHDADDDSSAPADGLPGDAILAKSVRGRLGRFLPCAAADPPYTGDNGGSAISTESDAAKKCPLAPSIALLTTRNLTHPTRPYRHGANFTEQPPAGATGMILTT
jgi:hypothetical protein